MKGIDVDNRQVSCEGDKHPLGSSRPRPKHPHNKPVQGNGHQYKMSTCSSYQKKSESSSILKRQDNGTTINVFS